VYHTNPDFVTFVGDGEPTLCRDLGWLIRETKKEPRLKTAVITNGSLLWQADVRQDLAAADVVIPSLDAGREETFKKIDRPHRSLDFDAVLQGLIDFSAGFHGQVWVEIMLVRGVNDTDEELLSIKRALERIDPDRVYLLTPIRPPAEAWVEPSDARTILKAQEIIGQAVSVASPESGHFSLENFVDAREAILEIGSRHPLRREQAQEIEKAFLSPGTVETMLKNRELIRAKYNGQTYVLPGHFKRGRKITRQK